MKANMISIDRSKKTSAMRKILKEVKYKVSEGKSIIIFPEGTRKKPGEKPNYKSGIIGIYKETKAKILPVSVNSGYCWPKHTFIKNSGHIIISFLKVISTNQNSSELIKKIENLIELETKKINFNK